MAGVITNVNEETPAVEVSKVTEVPAVDDITVASSEGFKSGYKRKNSAIESDLDSEEEKWDKKHKCMKKKDANSALSKEICIIMEKLKGTKVVPLSHQGISDESDDVSDDKNAIICCNIGSTTTFDFFRFFNPS